MVDTSPGMSLLHKLLGRVLRSADPTLLLLLSRWSDSWEKARINKAEIDANVQLIESVANAKSQLIKDVTKSMSQMITKVQSDELKTDTSAIGPDSISNVIESQLKRKATNLVTHLKYTIKELDGLLDIPDHDPNPAWTSRWINYAQDISSEELQKLWGKILAGEIKSPGQTSLRTLSILRDMTQKDAQDFFNLMQFRIDNFIFLYSLQKMSGACYDWMIRCSHIGLVGGFGEVSEIVLEDNGQWVVEHCGHALIIEGKPRQVFHMQTFVYPSVASAGSLITIAGLELAKLCQHREPDYQYLSHFANRLEGSGCILKLAKIVSQNGDKFQTSDEQVIKPFVEPEDRDQEEPGNAE